MDVYVCLLAYMYDERVKDRVLFECGRLWKQRQRKDCFLNLSTSGLRQRVWCIYRITDSRPDRGV